MSYPISVVVPIYNISSYIEKCLDSIVNQTTPPYEVVLVDDGSKDDSGIICDNYAKKYPYITVIHQQNGGPSKARNTGIENAKGDYIVFVDGDDWIDEKWLESYTKLLSDHGECDYIHWRQVMVYPDGEEELVDAYLKNCEVAGKSGKQVYAEHTNEKECIWLGPRGLFRRQLLLDNKIRFDTRYKYGEDEEFMVQVFYCAEKVLSNEFAGYYYRANRVGSLMSTFKVNQGVQQASIYKGWKAWIEAKKDTDGDEKRFFDALSFELNRRVWDLYSRCLFDCITNKKEKKLWYNTLKENKKMFEQSARIYAKGRMLKLIRFFGIAKATSLMNTVAQAKKRIKPKNSQA